MLTRSLIPNAKDAVHHEKHVIQKNNTKSVGRPSATMSAGANMLTAKVATVNADLSARHVADLSSISVADKSNSANSA